MLSAARLYRTLDSLLVEKHSTVRDGWKIIPSLLKMLSVKLLQLLDQPKQVLEFVQVFIALLIVKADRLVEWQKHENFSMCRSYSNLNKY